jgi:phosphopantetheinyl transferase
VAGSRLPFAIGNDVMDLADPRCGDRLADRRFMTRIFAEPERQWIQAADRPVQALWSLWAAKEAAYKVVSKRLGTAPAFEHAAFVVAPEPSATAGAVTYGDFVIPFRDVAPQDDEKRPFVHVVAWGPSEPGGWTASCVPLPAEPAPRERLTERESSAVYSESSAWVRILAKRRIASQLRLESSRIQIVCGPGRPGRMPPQLWIDGAPSDLDVSLSHHGGWVSWAVARSGDPGR